MIPFKDTDNPTEIDTQLAKRRETYQAQYIDKSEITLLSPSSFTELADSVEFQNKFDMVFFSTANASKLTDKFITNCVSKDGIVIVESPKYILDLKTQQIEDAVKAINQMAVDCNLEQIIDSSTNSLLTFQRSD